MREASHRIPRPLERGDLQARQMSVVLMAARYIGHLEVPVAQKMTNTKNFQDAIRRK